MPGVTIGSLASQVGMSKSGLFAHFKSKDDIDIALLEQMFELAQKNIVVPAMRAQPGLSRLTALVKNWFGWSTKAGLIGGCPDAAGMFELDDVEGPVREKLLELGENNGTRLSSNLLPSRLPLDTFARIWISISLSGS